MKSAILAGFVALATPSLHAISLSSFDDFASSADGWVEGGPSSNPPTHSTAPGPDGVDPGHLFNLSDAAGPGGRQLMWNGEAEWIGNYATAGVTGISLDVDNRSGVPSTLSLRIAFDGPGGWFASSPLTASDLSGGDEWTSLSYDLEAANFSYIAGSGGTADFSDTLAAVSRFEILVSAGPPTYAGAGDILQGDNLVSELHFDNVSAIPEPSTAVLIIAALGAMRFRRTQRR